MPVPASKAGLLSYASQDAKAAKLICEALGAAGGEVWLDQSELVGGDPWDQKIRGQIASCALFVPVVSAATPARRERYFRLERKLADERTHLMAEPTPLRLPVLIDDTKDRDALLSNSFLGVQWTRLPGGETSPAFVTHVQKRIGGPGAPTASAASAAPPATGVASSARGGLPPRLGVALGVVVLALIGFVVMRPGAKEIGPAAYPMADTKSMPVAVSAPAPVPHDKSIGVLACANCSPDKENEFFTDGVHEDILTNRLNSRALRVVSLSLLLLR